MAKKPASAGRSFYRKKRYWILLCLLVLLFDWVPLYFYVNYLGSKDGGLQHYEIDGSAEGYIASFNDQFSSGCKYDSCWTPLLYTSPHRPRLKFIEFEIRTLHGRSTDDDQRMAEHLGIPNEGNGWYRVQLEQRALENCPLLQKKRDQLNLVMARDSKLYERQVKQFEGLVKRKICPYVRKIDVPQSRYLEQQDVDKVIYWDGVHLAYRSDRWVGVNRLTGQPLFHYVRYAGRGTWVQPCARSSPSNSCGDLSPSFTAPPVTKDQPRPSSHVLDLLGFAERTDDIEKINLEQ